MNAIRIVNPARAMAFFQDKIDFTTGPLEVDRIIKSPDIHATIVDVREAEDFVRGHVPGAINLPKGTWESATELSKDTANIVYCYSQTCHLAANACVKFAERGFPVMEMDGGFEDWKEHDLEIEHATPNRLRRSADRLLHRRH